VAEGIRVISGMAEDQPVHEEVELALQACYRELSSSYRKPQGSTTSEPSEAWVQLVSAVREFTIRARGSQQPPERMLVELKAILERAVPNLEFASDLNALVVPLAIKNYYEPTD